MADLTSYEIENIRRSVAMLPPHSRDGLSREVALNVLEQLQRELERNDHPSNSFHR